MGRCGAALWGSHGAAMGHYGAALWGAVGRSGAALTLAAPPVGRQLVAGLAAALIAAQRVDAALLAAAVVGPRTFVHLCGEAKRSALSAAPPRPAPPPERPPPLKKLTANPALLMEPSETNFSHRRLEALLMSSGFS